MLSDEEKKTIADLAEADFNARERVRRLGMMNVPLDYYEREKAAIELAVAQAEAMATTKALGDAINNAQ